jgi:acyl-coenzyme A thioesterase PaaI-like protein
MSLTFDPVAVTDLMRSAAPLINTLGIVVESVDGVTAVLRLPNLETSRNHIGGPHAGAIFTLGETSAALLLATQFSGWLDRFVPLAVGANIRWVKKVRTDVTAEVRMDRDPAEIEAELEAGTRPEWTSHVTFRREDGEVCGEMDVVLTLQSVDRAG